jgi:hypothetical protein
MSRHATPIIRLLAKANVPNIICFGRACLVEKTICCRVYGGKTEEKRPLAGNTSDNNDIFLNEIVWGRDILLIWGRREKENSRSSEYGNET